MWWWYIVLLFNFALLFVGGHFVCRGASSIASNLRISPLVIAIAIIATSTSLPELATSVVALINHHSEIIIANIVGSNLVNIGFAAGLAAICRPFTITSRTINFEAPFLLAVTIIFSFCALFFWIDTTSGVLFILIGIAYTIYLAKTSKATDDAPPAEFSLKKAILIFLAGLIALLISAHYVVEASLQIAQSFGWSDSWLGFTIIAIGTSLPEIIVGVVAALKGDGAICTGNLIGSNLFNILFIIGVCSCVRPLTIDKNMCYIGLSSLIFMTALVWRFFTTKRQVSRIEGAILLAVYLLTFACLYQKY